MGIAGVRLRVLAAVVCVVAATWLALWYFIPAPPSSITIGAGLEGGAFEHIAKRYQARLARHHVQLNIRLTEGTLDKIRLLNDRSSGVDAAFLLGGLVDGTQAPGLISLGRINYAPIWIFYRSAEPLDRLTQLKGKRIQVGRGAGQIVIEILAAHGVNAQNTALLSVAGPAAVNALREGEADIIFLPQELNTPNVQSLLRDPTIRLMNVAQADALTRLFPALNRLVLPRGVIDLEKNIPATDVNLIALTNVLVAREDLHPELIYLLAQTAQKEHGAAGIFQRAGEFPTQTDPEFPFGEEALEFYRNGPSFLQRYLPFWMINYAKRVAAIVVTAIAIVIPLFTYTPRLYAWFLRMRTAKLYRRLRAIEAELLTELTAPRVMSLQSELETINRAAHVLPLRHSDLFFALILHIDMTRTRLASRLLAARG